MAVALTLWGASALAAPRDVVEPFSGRVPIERPEVPEGYVLRGTLGDVGVRLRGSAEVLAQTAQQDLRATIDISGLDAAILEEQEVPVSVAGLDPRVKVVEVSPAVVSVRLERLIARAMVVQLRFANDPPIGFQPGEPTLLPGEVVVTGAESVVGSVAAVYATVGFGDIGVDLLQSAQAIAVNAAGQQVEGVQVAPAGIQVNVPLLPTSTTRTLPVLWTVRGAVASGYWVSRVVTDPVAVTVRGSSDDLRALESIQTAAIDVTGLTSGRGYIVPLLLPEGVVMIQPRDATVTVTVTALTGSRSFPAVVVRVDNLEPDRTAEVSPEAIALIISGPLPTLLGLEPASVTASVDAAGRPAGTHVIDLVVGVPEGLTVQSVQPARVTVTIRSE